MKLVINRKIWLRGEGHLSKLLRKSDGKMCCLGIYLEACGVSRKDLSDKSTPACLVGTKSAGLVPAWTVSNTDCSEACYGIMTCNDNREMRESTREDEINRVFAQHDVDVEFVG